MNVGHCLQIPGAFLTSWEHGSARTLVVPLSFGAVLCGTGVVGSESRLWPRCTPRTDKTLSVPAPCHVRYAWANDPDHGLGDLAELPASPVRADDPRTAMGTEGTWRLYGGE